MRVVFVLLAAIPAALAQDAPSLSGRVTDPSGSAVPNARVALTDRGSQVTRSTATDSTGFYSFQSLRKAEYVVEAQAEGLGTAEPRRVRVDGAAHADLPLQIARVATQVQVTAAAIAQTIDEQSKALSVIDAGQLERRAEYSVAEALRSIPGVKVQQLGGPGSFTRVITRGMRAMDTSFLVDGFRFRDAASPQGDATAFIGDLLLANTDRIEVLRGSGSSLYGTHATGGVVNVITDQGGGAFRGDFTAEGGGLGVVRSTARFSGGAMQDRLRFAGGATHLNVTRGLDGADRTRNTTGHGFVQWLLSPATVVTGRVLVSDIFSQLNDTPYAASELPAGPLLRAVPNATFIPAPDDPDQRREGMSTNTLLALSHNWGSRVSTRLSYSGVSTRRDNRDGPGGSRFEPQFNDSNRFDGRIDTLQARTDVQLDSRHSLTAGYEFEREAFDNLSSAENPLEPVSASLHIRQTSHAGFAQAQGRYFGGRLQLLASGRIQKFDLSRPEFTGGTALYQNASIPSPPQARTGDVSGAWMIAKSSTKLRAHVGNGYRAPALYERFGSSFFFGSFSAYGDPRLSPERLLSFDTGIDQYFAGSRVRVSATYFYTRIQEAIIFDFSGAIVPPTDPYSRFGGYRNSNGGLARGVEMSVEANPSRSLTVQSSYTYTNADDRTSQYGNNILRSVRVSDHMFTATASQRLGKRFDVTADLFAASNYLIPFSGRALQFDGPVKADLVAAYTYPVSDRHRVRLYTRVENLLNRTYYEEGFRTPKAWAVAGVKWLF